MTTYGEASPDRIAETNVLLEALASSPSYSAYLTAYSAVEQRANSEDLMGRWEERDRIWNRVRVIAAEARPRIKDEYRSIPVMSLDELCDHPVNLLDAVRQFRREASAYPISQATADDFLCALVAASTSLDSVREGSDQLVGVAAE